MAPGQATIPAAAAEKHRCDLHCPEQIHAQAAVAMTALPEGGTHKRE